MVSLAGLMLALGMLVDNSVVVIESIFRHRNELGEDAKTAALAGAGEVALPIMASTATTICVFLPMIFLAAGGRFKLYLENIGWTVLHRDGGVARRRADGRPDGGGDHSARPEPATRPAQSRGCAAPTPGRFEARLRHRFAFSSRSPRCLPARCTCSPDIEQSVSTRALERQVILKVDTPRQYSPEQTSALYDELYELIDARRDELDIADIAYNYDRGTGRSRSSWRRSRQFDIYLKDETESESDHR